MTSYSDKLEDPRWQKMRLKVLERDEFTCQVCFNTESELHIHHKYYKKNLEPWEYPLKSLETICSECHADISANGNLPNSLVEALSNICIGTEELMNIIDCSYRADNFSFMDGKETIVLLNRMIINKEFREKCLKISAKSSIRIR